MIQSDSFVSDMLKSSPKVLFYFLLLYFNELQTGMLIAFEPSKCKREPVQGPFVREEKRNKQQPLKLKLEG